MELYRLEYKQCTQPSFFKGVQRSSCASCGTGTRDVSLTHLYIVCNTIVRRLPTLLLCFTCLREAGKWQFFSVACLLIRAFVGKVALHCRHPDRETIYFLTNPDCVEHSSLVSYGSVTLVCHHIDIGKMYYLPILGGIHRDSPALYGSFSRRIPLFLLVYRMQCQSKKALEACPCVLCALENLENAHC